MVHTTTMNEKKFINIQWNYDTQPQCIKLYKTHKYTLFGEAENNYHIDVHQELNCGSVYLEYISAEQWTMFQVISFLFVKLNSPYNSVIKRSIHFNCFILNEYLLYTHEIYFYW